MARTPPLAHNVGRIDRAFRIVFGTTLIVVWLFVPFVWWAGALLGVLGAVLIITGVAGSCPLYRALGIATRRDR